MKRFFKAAAVVMALAFSAAVFGACGETKDESTASVSEKSEVDYSKPDVTIEKDDYNGMKNFADEMLAGKHDDKVVKIDGTTTRSTMSVKASIMESDGGSQKIGVTYKIAGAESIDEYPAEGAETTITGVVKTDENGVRFIEVPKDKLETK